MLEGRGWWKKIPAGALQRLKKASSGNPLARLTRHELKKDELGARLSVLMEFFLANRRRITVAALGGVVAIVLGLGIFLYVRTQQVRAADAFARALNTYHAPVLPTSPQMPSLVFFKTNEEKYQKAHSEFLEVAQQYSLYAAGRAARYYAALCQRELGNFAEAEKELEALAGGRNANLAALAKLALASVYEQTDRSAEAERIYRELEENPTSTVPKAAALLARADLYRKTQRPEAASLYEQIEREYAGSTAGEYARRQLQEIGR